MTCTGCGRVSGVSVHLPLALDTVYVNLVTPHDQICCRWRPFTIGIRAPHHPHPLRTPPRWRDVFHVVFHVAPPPLSLQSRLQLMNVPASPHSCEMVDSSQLPGRGAAVGASAPCWRIGVRHCACSFWCNMRWVSLSLTKVPLHICTTRLQRSPLTWLRLHETTHLCACAVICDHRKVQSPPIFQPNRINF